MCYIIRIRIGYQQAFVKEEEEILDRNFEEKEFSKGREKIQATSRYINTDIN
jgi:hypothetical protein